MWGCGCAHVVATQTDVDFKEVQNAPTAKKVKLVNSDYGCYLLFRGKVSTEENSPKSQNVTYLDLKQRL